MDGDNLPVTCHSETELGIFYFLPSIVKAYPSLVTAKNNGFVQRFTLVLLQPCLLDYTYLLGIAGDHSL
nr:hypothetical protein Q903MT_gene855 [Picea sitchensis]